MPIYSGSITRKINSNPLYEQSRKRIGGERTYVYKGIRFIEVGKRQNIMENLYDEIDNNDNLDQNLEDAMEKTKREYEEENKVKKDDKKLMKEWEDVFDGKNSKEPLEIIVEQGIIKKLKILKKLE